MTKPKGNILVYPPVRPDMPYIAVRFAGYGIFMASVAKSEDAARAMLLAHEQGPGNRTSSPDSRD
jgi:hypothetical protein